MQELGYWSSKMRVIGSVFATALLAAGACGEPVPRAAKAPTVDLGYSVYEGSYDANNSINIFKGFVVLLLRCRWACN